MAANPVEFPASRLRLDVNRATAGVIVISCGGRLISDTAQEFKTQVKSHLVPNGRMILDLSDLTYMDSSGLGALVSVYVSAKGAKCELKLINLGERIQQLLRLTKLISVFEPFGEYL